tara:strand:+ start:1141 stop:1938 length:798 start_codon:yes stop_codon:yes gene_type:complete
MEHLNLKQIAEECPSVLTSTHSENLSKVYKKITTTDVIDILEKNNWKPTHAIQVGTRKGNEKTIPFKKHMVRFRNPHIDLLSSNIGGYEANHPEIVVTNSHDGKSSFKFHVGVFRLVCGNGLVIADKTFDSFKINHKGFDQSKVLNVLDEVTQNIPSVMNRVEVMMNRKLNTRQKEKFALESVNRRWGSDRHIVLTDLLKINRTADRGSDMWTVFNRVQENMLKGGLNSYVKKDGEYKYSKTRPVTSIDNNLKINKMLWELAENF